MSGRTAAAALLMLGGCACAVTIGARLDERLAREAAAGP